MWKLPLILLLVAFIAAALGYGGTAGAATGLAQALWWVFLALFVLSSVYALRQRR